MRKIEKIIGEVSGYVAIIIWIILFVFSVVSLPFDFHFKGDIFVVILLVALSIGFRETYLDYRDKQEMEKI